MHLYEITENYRRALSELSDIEDLPEEAIKDTLDAIAGEAQVKGRAVAAYFLNLDAEVAAMKEAERRMAERRKSAEARVESLKKYLLENMLELGIQKIECPEFEVSLRLNPLSVEIYDEKAIPNEFWREKIVREVDKKCIKDFGGCDGARIIQKYRLAIK